MAVPWKKTLETSYKVPRMSLGGDKLTVKNSIRTIDESGMWTVSVCLPITI